MSIMAVGLYLCLNENLLPQNCFASVGEAARNFRLSVKKSKNGERVHRQTIEFSSRQLSLHRETGNIKEKFFIRQNRCSFTLYKSAAKCYPLFTAYPIGLANAKPRLISLSHNPVSRLQIAACTFYFLTGWFPSGFALPERKSSLSNVLMRRVLTSLIFA